MTSSKQGFRLEHDVSNEVHTQTGSEIRSYRCGYSGNNLAPTPDLLITTPLGNKALELKKTSVEKGFRIEEDDIIQLKRCTNGYTRAYFGVKFTHREMVVFEAKSPYPNSNNVADYVAENVPYEFNPRVPSTDLLLDKPSTDEWPSSRSGDDNVTVLLNKFGINDDGDEQQTFDIQEVEA